MRVLTVLTYYRPHTSGLTIYAERLAHALVRRGHEVTIFTTQYQKSLPREERLDGVHILRVPVASRLSKGVIAPSFGWMATRMVRQHDVVHLHLPQFDAPGVALRGIWRGTTGSGSERSTYPGNRWSLPGDVPRMQLAVDRIKALRWKPQLGSQESIRIAVQAMLAERQH